MIDLFLIVSANCCLPSDYARGVDCSNMPKCVLTSLPEVKAEAPPPIEPSHRGSGRVYFRLPKFDPDGCKRDRSDGSICPVKAG